MSSDWLQAKELSQLKRTIAALSTTPPPQQQQKPEWAEFYDLDSSPDGGSGVGGNQEQLGVFGRGTQHQVNLFGFSNPLYSWSTIAPLNPAGLVQGSLLHGISAMLIHVCLMIQWLMQAQQRAPQRAQQHPQYTVEEPPSPKAAKARDLQTAAPNQHPGIQKHPRIGCLVEVCLLIP